MFVAAGPIDDVQTSVWRRDFSAWRTQSRRGPGPARCGPGNSVPIRLHLLEPAAGRSRPPLPWPKMPKTATMAKNGRATPAGTRSTCCAVRKAIRAWATVNRRVSPPSTPRPSSGWRRRRSSCNGSSTRRRAATRCTRRADHGGLYADKPGAEVLGLVLCLRLVHEQWLAGLGRGGADRHRCRDHWASARPRACPARC